MSSENKQRIVYVLTRTNKADDDDTDIYIGSTSQSLNDRLGQHRYKADVIKENSKLYERMREVGTSNFEILPLLSRTCDIKTIRELERKWCEILKADLNTNLPILTPDEKKQQKSDYYESNKEVIRQRHADYRKSNKDAILKKQAEYYETNKDAILKKRVDYYKLNKQGKKYYCEVCDMFFGKSDNLKQHLKTQKHFWKYMNSVD